MLSNTVLVFYNHFDAVNLNHFVSDCSVDDATHLPATNLTPEFAPGNVDMMICINMIHIAPFACTRALLRMAGSLLGIGKPLLLYGPFRVNGTMVESNAAFDESLKNRNSEWGIRDLETVVSIAEECGLSFEASHDMPANNLTVLFRRI